MIAVALFYDMAQAGLDVLHLIPFIGNAFAIMGTMIIDLWAFLTFYVWFKIHGVSFASPKRGLTMAGAVIIELIPVVNALPAWTAAVVILFLTTRGEEALASTLSRVEGAAGAVGKGAALAGKIPGAPAGVKQGLTAASQGANAIAAGARGAREQLQSLPPDKRLHLETASKARVQAKPGEQPPVLPAAASRPPQATPDIGSQPVFRQRAQEQKSEPGPR